MTVFKKLVVVLSRFSRVRLFATLWTVARQAPLSLGSPRQEYWSGLPCPPPGVLPHPGMEPVSTPSPALQVNSLPLSLWGSPIEELKINAGVTFSMAQWENYWIITWFCSLVTKEEARLQYFPRKTGKLHTWLSSRKDYWRSKQHSKMGDKVLYLHTEIHDCKYYQ